MKRIRYLTLLWMLFSGILSWAQGFNPTDPAEPGQLTRPLTLTATPSGAGSVSGGGYYVAGTLVTVTASPYSQWEFANWTDENGTVVSTSPSYTFTKGDKSERLTANFAFNPSAPGEPDELPSKLTLLATDGGSVSGGGYYKRDTEVSIYASAYSRYDFVGWFLADGTCYSTDASTTYTMGGEAITLTARFVFNPGSPSEPGEVNLWRLKLTAQDGGIVSADKYLLKEGEATAVRASANSGYVFDGWYQGETLVSQVADFDYIMGGTGATLEAHFLFSPNAPDEPGQIQQRKFSFTLKNVITKPGTTAQFPILLTPRATLGDMTLQLNFDPRLNVDIDNVVVATTTTPYTLAREAITSGDTYDEGFVSYKFTLTGGSIVVSEDETPTVTPILTFPIIIPSDIATATAYKISINQISMTNADGTTQTAGARNGRVSVYKLGDTNGDNEVDASDVLNMVNVSLSKDSEVFIKEVSDINEDSEIDSSDVLGVVNISLNK